MLVDTCHSGGGRRRLLCDGGGSGVDGKWWLEYVGDLVWRPVMASQGGCGAAAMVVEMVM